MISCQSEPLGCFLEARPRRAKAIFAHVQLLLVTGPGRPFACPAAVERFASAGRACSNSPRSAKSMADCQFRAASSSGASAGESAGRSRSRAIASIARSGLPASSMARISASASLISTSRSRADSWIDWRRQGRDAQQVLPGGLNVVVPQGPLGAIDVAAHHVAAQGPDSCGRRTATRPSRRRCASSGRPFLRASRAWYFTIHAGSRMASSNSLLGPIS